jgi:hypothetical protein
VYFLDSDDIIFHFFCYVSIIQETTDIYLIGSPITRLFAMLTVLWLLDVSLFIYTYSMTYNLVFVNSKTPIVTKTLQLGRKTRGVGSAIMPQSQWGV